MVVLGRWLDLMILEVFSSLCFYDSVFNLDASTSFLVCVLCWGGRVCGVCWFVFIFLNSLTILSLKNSNT